RRPYVLGTFALFAVGALTVAGVAQTWPTDETEFAWKKTGRDGRLNAPAAGDERELAAADRGAAKNRAGAPARGAQAEGAFGAMPMGGAGVAMPAGPGAPPPPMAPGMPAPKPDAKPADAKGDVAKNEPAKMFDDA